MKASRWMLIDAATTLYPTNGRGESTDNPALGAFATSRRKGVTLQALYITGQHATDEQSIAISGVTFTIPPRDEVVLFGPNARIDLGGADGWWLPDGFTVTASSADATAVLWYDLLDAEDRG